MVWTGGPTTVTLTLPLHTTLTRLAALSAVGGRAETSDIHRFPPVSAETRPSAGPPRHELVIQVELRVALLKTCWQIYFCCYRNRERSRRRTAQKTQRGSDRDPASLKPQLLEDTTKNESDERALDRKINALNTNSISINRWGINMCEICPL